MRDCLTAAAQAEAPPADTVRMRSCEVDSCAHIVDAAAGHKQSGRVRAMTCLRSAPSIVLVITSFRSAQSGKPEESLRPASYSSHGVDELEHECQMPTGPGEDYVPGAAAVFGGRSWLSTHTGGGLEKCKDKKGWEEVTGNDAPEAGCRLKQAAAWCRVEADGTGGKGFCELGELS
eukprot:scaffold156057_cov19-Tisochrysis_lutea.AAC.2